MSRLVLVVAAALLDAEGRVLLAERPAGKSMAGLWEFPGGKIEAGETPEAALVRELREELSIEIDVRALRPLTFASFAYDSFHLLMPLYACREWAGRVHPAEQQRVAWVWPSSLKDYPAPPADLPLFEALEAEHAKWRSGNG